MRLPGPSLLPGQPSQALLRWCDDRLVALTASGDLCALDVADRYVDVLRCVVYDQDLTKREVLGEVLVLLAPLELHARVDDWYPIVQADGSAQSSRSLFSFASATADDDDQTEKSRGFLRLKLKLEPLA